MSLIRKTTFLTSILFLALLSGTSMAQRKVLVEQFTNSGCPPCAGNTPVVAAYVNSNPSQVLMLAYHTSFPYNDSMYYENALQSNERVSYYNVPSVPNSYVDGNYFSGNLVPTLSGTITTRAADAPRYSINFMNSSLSGSTLTAQVVFQSVDANNQGESLVAMIVATEKDVLKSSYLASPGNNSETVYPWVVRRMLPDENGTTLVNNSLNGVDSVNVSWSVNNFKDLNELRVIAFVQNVLTKEVYQAEISTPQIFTGIFSSPKVDEELFTLFSSAANDFISVHLNKLSNNSTIKVFDQLGQPVYSASVNSFDFQIKTSGYSNGIYFVQLQDGSLTQTKKFSVTR